MNRKTIYGLGTGRGRRWFLGVPWLVAAALMMLGCQSTQMGYGGATLAPASQIPLTEGPKQISQYETLDVMIDYEYVRSGDSLQLSGTVRYGAGLRHNFVMVPEFYMRLFFADANGRVLSYQGVPISGYGYVDDVMRFRENLTLPPGTAFMAFGYTGQARDTGGGGHDGGGGTEAHFFYDPAVH